MVRQVTAITISMLLALSPLPVWTAPSAGTVQGLVTVEGRPLSGLGLALVDLNSGEIHRAKSGAGGAFSLSVAPGEYVLTNVSGAGLAISRAPARVVVQSGRIASASIDLMRLPVVWEQDPAQTPPTGPQQSGNITHDPIGCIVAGQFPLIDATLDPPGNIARARVYFKSALGDDYFFVEMTPAPPPPEGLFNGKLPKPQLAASPITYHIMTTTTDFVESLTPDYQAIVVSDESECPEKVRVAPIGPPGAVTVFSAASGGIVSGAVLGGGAALIAGGTLAAILVGGAIVAGTVAATTGDETTTTTTTTTTVPTTPTVTVTTITTTTTTTTLPKATPTTTLCGTPPCGEPFITEVFNPGPAQPN